MKAKAVKGKKAARRVDLDLELKKQTGGCSVRDSASEAVLEYPTRKSSPKPRPAEELLREAVEQITRKSGLVKAGQWMVEVFDRQAAGLRKPVADAGLTGALLRGRIAREELKQEEGGSLSASEAAERLGISKQAVLKRFHLGQLLGWREAKQGAVRMPVWQFAEDDLLPGLSDTLAVLHQASWMDDWARVLFFLNRRTSLEGQRPLDLLRIGEKEKVLQVALAGIQ